MLITIWLMQIFFEFDFFIKGVIILDNPYFEAYTWL